MDKDEISKDEVDKVIRYSMGKAAKELGISKETLYRWEKKGKIPKAKRVVRNNQRVYTPEDILKIREFKDEIDDPGAATLAPTVGKDSDEGTADRT
jgi:hypothetical protein